MNSNYKNLEIIIISIILLIVIYFIYKKFFKKENYIDIEGNEIISEDTENVDDINGSSIDDVVRQLDEENPKYQTTELKNTLEIDWLNKAEDGKYKYSSYNKGGRNNETALDALDTYDTQLAESIDYSKMNSNDEFDGMDETKGKYAGYKQKRTKKYSTDEIFDTDKLLPQELNKDWFEFVPEPIKVKNRHLINIAKPGAGIDTVGSSKRNATHDIRGDISNPKFIVGPFNQSSIQPDVNTVGFCNRNVYE